MAKHTTYKLDLTSVTGELAAMVNIPEIAPGSPLDAAVELTVVIRDDMNNQTAIFALTITIRELLSAILRKPST